MVLLVLRLVTMSRQVIFLKGRGKGMGFVSAAQLLQACEAKFNPFFLF